MATPPRIFFDTNEGTHKHGYELRLAKSEEDLEALGGKLCEGLRVLIYMPDELEMLATLRRDFTQGLWIADPVPGTLRYLDGSDAVGT